MLFKTFNVFILIPFLLVHSPYIRFSLLTLDLLDGINVFFLYGFLWILVALLIAVISRGVS